MARTKNRVTGVIIRDGKILLIHRFKNNNEYWVFPGGGVEEGETLEQGLQREIMEETGLKLLKSTELFRNMNKSQDTCIFYGCVVGTGDPRLGGPELEEDSDDNRHILSWVPFADIFSITNLYPSPDKDVLEKYYDHL